MAGPPIAERYVAPLFVRRDGKDLPWGMTRNLSVSGMFLETEDRDPVGTEYTISIVWGDEIYACRARVMRHGSAGLGLMFIDPDASFLRTVQEVIDSSPVAESAGKPPDSDGGSKPAD